MARFELQPVTIGNADGQGYAFKRKTAFGQARRGIVFLEDTEQVEALKDRDAITFCGPCYYKDRGPREREFEVYVEDVTDTMMGPRVDFVEVDYPEMLLDR